MNHPGRDPGIDRPRHVRLAGGIEPRSTTQGMGKVTAKVQQPLAFRFRAAVGMPDSEVMSRPSTARSRRCSRVHGSGGTACREPRRRRRAEEAGHCEPGPVSEEERGA